MSDRSIESELDVAYRITDRPIPVPGDVRVVRRLALIVLLLDHCRGGVGTIDQLSVLDWAVRNEETRRAYRGFHQGKLRPDQVTVRFDPAFPRAIRFALAEGLLAFGDFAGGRAGAAPSELRSQYMVLTEKGLVFLSMVRKWPDCLADEKLFLRDLGHRVTRAETTWLVKWGR